MPFNVLPFLLCRKVMQENKILNVFDCFIVELLRKLFRQLRSASPLFLVQPNLVHDPWSQISKNLFAPLHNRTVTNKKPLTNVLQKAYIWFKKWYSIPFPFWKMSSQQLKYYS